MSTQNRTFGRSESTLKAAVAYLLAGYMFVGEKLEAFLFRLGEAFVKFANPGDELALAGYQRTATRYGRADRAQTTNIAGLFIGIMVATIIGVDVAIPVILDAVANSSVSGNTETILDLLPLFIGLLLLIALASPLMNRL